MTEVVIPLQTKRGRKSNDFSVFVLFILLLMSISAAMPVMFDASIDEGKLRLENA